MCKDDSIRYSRDNRPRLRVKGLKWRHLDVGFFLQQRTTNSYAYTFYTPNYTISPIPPKRCCNNLGNMKVLITRCISSHYNRTAVLIIVQFSAKASNTLVWRLLFELVLVRISEDWSSNGTSNGKADKDSVTTSTYGAMVNTSTRTYYWCTYSNG
jgi:hypothetical protein